MYYILRLQKSTIQYISNDTVKTKLAILTFLFYKEFVKKSTVGSYFENSIASVKINQQSEFWSICKCSTILTIQVFHFELKNSSNLTN